MVVCSKFAITTGNGEMEKKDKEKEFASMKHFMLFSKQKNTS